MFKFAVAACAVLASAAAQGRVSFPPRPVVPSGWAEQGPSPKDAVVPLMFAVKQRNVDKLMQIVDDVSTPTSPKYGQVCVGARVWGEWAAWSRGDGVWRPSESPTLPNCPGPVFVAGDGPLGPPPSPPPSHVLCGGV